jgi:hypothetical protein
MTTKAKNRRAAKTRTPIEPPQRHKERPTPERMAHGRWRLGETIEAGVKVAIDDAAHPLEALFYDKFISQDQYQAGTDFEALYRAQLEVPQARDSCTIWEPKGHDETDGPVEERRRYREICRTIGMVNESRLIAVCVYQQFPKGQKAMGEFREALNMAVHAFSPGGKRKRLHPF